MSTENELKSLSDEQKQKLVKEINTELTSVADEERKTGKKIDVPSAENLVAIASASLIRQRKLMSNLMPTMSKRALIRAFTAIMDLPTDGVPVFLKDDEEKKLFAFGQRAISDRYVIITHHIKKAIAEDRLRKLEEAEKAKQSEGQSNGETTTEGQ